MEDQTGKGRASDALKAWPEAVPFLLKLCGDPVWLHP